MRASIPARAMYSAEPVAAKPARPAASMAAEAESAPTSSWRDVPRWQHLDLAVGVLVDGEGVDHAHRVVLAEPLKLLDDLSVEIRVLEAEHEELDWSDRHMTLLSALFCRVHTARDRAMGLQIGPPSTCCLVLFPPNSRCNPQVRPVGPADSAGQEGRVDDPRGRTAAGERREQSPYRTPCVNDCARGETV